MAPLAVVDIVAYRHPLRCGTLAGNWIPCCGCSASLRRPQTHAIPESSRLLREERTIFHRRSKGLRDLLFATSGGCGSTWRKCMLAMRYRWVSRPGALGFEHVGPGLLALATTDERILSAVPGQFEQWSPLSGTQVLHELMGSSGPCSANHSDSRFLVTVESCALAVNSDGNLQIG